MITTSEPKLLNDANSLLQEANELNLILSSIVKKSSI